jgi:hypothetical protein
MNTENAINDLSDRVEVHTDTLECHKTILEEQASVIKELRQLVISQSLLLNKLLMSSERVAAADSTFCWQQPENSRAGLVPAASPASPASPAVSGT